jgi:hypothetical protein
MEEFEEASREEDEIAVRHRQDIARVVKDKL